MLLRRGNAGSNTAADHITILRRALRQLPADNQRGHRTGRSVLVRIDGAGSTHELLDCLTARNLSYSVGFGLPDHTPELLKQIPQQAWCPVLDADGQVRDGAWVAELTGLLELGRWPAGMRVIARVERPHPGAQLRITDHNGNRVTAFATNTRPGGPAAQIADLELRHRRRARCEDRIRAAKDTGLRNLPLHGFDQNRIWCQIVQLACELLAWTQMLGYPAHPARRWEPKRLRLRLFGIAGGLARHARQLVLHLGAEHPWTALLLAGRTAITSPPPRTRVTACSALCLLDPGTPDRPVDPATPPQRGHLVVPLGHHHRRQRPPSRETTHQDHERSGVLTPLVRGDHQMGCLWAEHLFATRDRSGRGPAVDRA